MLKWLGGCLVIVIVLIAAGSWWAMRTMKESLGPGGTAVVTIGTLPPRVFASLANADSIPTWMGQGNTVAISRAHGPLVVGDTIRVGLRATFGVKQEPMVWTITRIVPDTLIVRTLATKSTQRMMAVRRDSLFRSAADSTTIVSTLISPVLDSLQRDRATVTGEMMLSMLRMQSKLELQNLKGRIESASGQTPAPRR